MYQEPILSKRCNALSTLFSKFIITKIVRYFVMFRNCGEMSSDTENAKTHSPCGEGSHVRITYLCCIHYLTLLPLNLTVRIELALPSISQLNN